MNKKLLCWVLAFSLAFQPLIFEGIAWAQEAPAAPPANQGSTGSTPDAGAGTGGPEGTTAADQAKKAEEAQKKFDETYTTLMKTEEIKNPSNSGGIGGFFKKAALWVTGNKGAVDKAVNEANAELKKAKEEMTKMKTELTAGVVSAKDAALQNAQATMQKNLELSAKLQTAISMAMKKIGDFMTKLSGTLKTVASTLQKVATGVALIPTIGTAISAVLFTVAKVLGGVSGVVGAVGKSMIAFSQKADLSAKDFLGMITDAKNGWKDGAKGFGRPPKTPKPATPGAGNGTVPGGAPTATVPAPAVSAPQTPPAPSTTQTTPPAGTTPGSSQGAANPDLPGQGASPQRGAPSTTHANMFVQHTEQYKMGQEILKYKADPTVVGGKLEVTGGGFGAVDFTYKKEGNNTMPIKIRTKMGTFSDDETEIYVDPSKVPLGFTNRALDNESNLTGYGSGWKVTPQNAP